ncbi:MAG: carboxylesterase/lipase family protein, partial [Acidobacteria bacterium]|nr:carboxylesterase/lipase family protein [Acidobacteriota bacterium]
VFGESAGAMSLGALLAAPAARGLFRRAVLQSGAAAHVGSREATARQGRAFLEALDFDRFDTERLRELPAAAILEAQQASTRRPTEAILLPWQPVYGDDLLPRRPLEAIADGAAAGIELLVGTNADEWKLFTAGMLRLHRLCEAELEARAQRLFRRHGLFDVDARRAVEIYRAGRTEDASPYELWVAMRTDEIFRIPAVELLEAQAAHEPRVFSYRLDLPVPAMPDLLGACHGSDLPLLFGSFDHPYLLPFYLHRRSARQLSERMQDAWTAFARRGSPAHGSVGPWPSWDPVARKTLLLDRRCSLERAPHEAERRIWSGAATPVLTS